MCFRSRGRINRKRCCLSAVFYEWVSFILHTYSLSCMYGSQMILNEDADTILPGRAGTERSIDGSLLSLFLFCCCFLRGVLGLFVCHQQSTVWESLLEIAVDILNFDDECAPHVLKVNLWTRLRIHLGLKYLPECSKEPTGCPRPWRNLLPGFRKWKIGRWRRSCCRERATTRRDEPMAAAGQRMPAAAGDRRQKSGNGVMLSYFLDRLPHQRQSR